jgi:uncharacterized protein YciW
MTSPHVLEQAAGIETMSTDNQATDTQSSLAKALTRRAKLMELTQASYEAALLPEEPGGLDYAERAALACRMARICQQQGLSQHYEELLASCTDTQASTDGISALASPDTQPPADDARLQAIVAYVDKVTRSPKDAVPDDIESLRAAGMDESDIVRLAGLVAFVNYQLRVAAVLAVMGDSP